MTAPGLWQLRTTLVTHRQRRQPLGPTSTFAKEHRVDFLGLLFLPSAQQPAPSEKVLLLMSCGGLQVNVHSH